MSKQNNVPLVEEPVEVQCTRPDALPDGTRCNYKWKTKSPLNRVSCPNCGFPNNKAKAIAKAKESRKQEEGSQPPETTHDPATG